MPEVAIILPTLNSGDYIQNCLRKICARALGKEYEHIPEMLKKFFFSPTTPNKRAQTCDLSSPRIMAENLFKEKEPKT